MENILLDYITEKDKNKRLELFYKYVIENEIQKLEKSLEEEDEVESSLNDFVTTGLTPCKVDEILNELGYSQTDCDTNGWQGDTWMTYKKKGHPSLVLFYEGWTFELRLTMYSDEYLNC